MKYLLAIDLETTGLDPAYHEITQLAVVLLDSQLERLGSYSSLVKIQHPNRGLEDNFDVYEFTGIKQSDLEVAPEPSIVASKLIKFIRSKIDKEHSTIDVTLFGQNTQFDIKFLRKFLSENNQSIKLDYHVISLDSIFTAYYLAMYGTLPTSVSLATMCEHFKIQNAKPHDAMSDITTTLGIFKHIINQIKKPTNEG